jgi:hypothetical protein
MPGFLLGSVVLIATWVLVQDGTSGRVEQASNVAVALLRRVMSADAAGIGNHAKPTTKATLNPPAAPAGGGGAGGHKFY